MPYHYSSILFLSMENVYLHREEARRRVRNRKNGGRGGGGEERKGGRRQFNASSVGRELFPVATYRYNVATSLGEATKPRSALSWPDAKARAMCTPSCPSPDCFFLSSSLLFICRK